ncbi:oxalate decarboxylase OxdC [Sporosarcina sp. NCCP-2222]|uniref:oxalate decarboxylase family bicupin n=1 Tax=Sporosarcina sp. NCCP-2222 TaxID=2935073 RepID=UPI0020881E9A|nr:oxalate decarboxylase family bicupin [Sporosarcina sp. NCCP-2222]GKV56482.1 oxalate decarboxylase OxdC [Sporosarcina sp. NCCP-2222]
MRKEYTNETTNQTDPQPIKGERGGPILGAKNPEIDRQNPDILVPPDTDHGTMPNLKFPYAQSHMRVEYGGWSREVTVREMPAAKTIAGVNMHLEPGGVRELHWHKEAEWSYMIKGKARITAISPSGREFVDDVEAGDLWYFPSGVPHSIKGLSEGAEFVLAFDDGGFSENSTFSITDWFAHTPKDILAANFGVSEEEFDGIPDGEVYMYQGEVPGPIAQGLPEDANEFVEESFSFKLKDVKPVETSGGKAWIADSTNFPISKTIAAALVEVEPGGIRELHWHPNEDEWQYYLEGQGRMTVFASGGKARTYDYRAGDVGYVPFAMGHYVQNTGDTPLVFLEMFRSDHFADVSLNQWMSQTPPELLKEHLPLSDEFIKNALHADKRPNVKYN